MVLSVRAFYTLSLVAQVVFVCVCVCSQSAWEEVEQCYFELSQTRKRHGQLETEIIALMRKAETAHETDPVSR